MREEGERGGARSRKDLLMEDNLLKEVKVRERTSKKGEGWLKR